MMKPEAVLTQMINSMYLLSAFGEQNRLSSSFDRNSIVLPPNHTPGMRALGLTLFYYNDVAYDMRSGKRTSWIMSMTAFTLLLGIFKSSPRYRIAHVQDA